MTMKFNMINWALETVGTILVIILPTSSSIILSMLLSSCGTPVVYLLGIEDNLKTAREIVMEKIMVVKRNKVNPISKYN